MSKSGSFPNRGRILRFAVPVLLLGLALFLSTRKPLEPLTFTTYEQFLTELTNSPADQWSFSVLDIPPEQHPQAIQLLSQGTAVDAWADASTYRPFQQAPGVDYIYARDFLYDAKSHTTLCLYEMADGCHLMVRVSYQQTIWEYIYYRILTNQMPQLDSALYHLATLPSGTITTLGELAAPISLFWAELDFFNNNSFFDNGDRGGMNIRNQFLTSFYDNPKDVDLFRLFYCDTGQETRTQRETQEILNDIIAFVPFYPDAGCNIVTTDEMNQVLSEHMGLTLEETNKVGLDTMTYLPQRDLYFHFHSDTNYAYGVHFTNGERQGNTIRLYYRNSFDPSGSRDCVLTLQKEGDSYRFLSNLPLTAN